MSEKMFARKLQLFRELLSIEMHLLQAMLYKKMRVQVL